ncbi:hypothetical protein M640_02595 [Listeria monocytogenes]|nr:hypothetical protein M637_06335 [Listeria monocytogenes]ERH75373.1 hypothetical protein O171_08930 [Listeria monocytogenes serotype 4bV str. LS645]ERH76084.1 hypothetical protein O167_08525 [Listeria monocytogenes serotype 4bV str. LS642]ERH85393.1 hypothetical protein O174_00780 [Listeria monocytogenes serotype 4bV str. LS644]ERH85880.1 hypothetical protein N895_03750 [Listeria monocytogenes serotype 4bV str. LS542]ERH86340.1 hypothetical protein O168_01325 [Listeria monocytogenes serotype
MGRKYLKVKSLKSKQSVDEEEINRSFGGSLPAVHAVVKSYLQITWVTKWTE